MSSVSNLFENLNRAIISGNEKEIEEAKRKILMSGRDSSIDENFIKSISGKTLFRNVKKLINEDKSLSNHDYAKIISSMITHSIIESEKTGIPYSDYGVNEMYIVLGKLISGEEGAINETRDFVSSRYSEFIQG